MIPCNNQLHRSHSSETHSLYRTVTYKFTVSRTDPKRLTELETTISCNKDSLCFSGGTKPCHNKPHYPLLQSNGPRSKLSCTEPAERFNNLVMLMGSASPESPVTPYSQGDPNPLLSPEASSPGPKPPQARISTTGDTGRIY